MKVGHMAISHTQFAHMTLEQAAAGVRSGEFLPADLLAASIERMDAFEPAINAVVTRDDNAARADADAKGAAKTDAVLHGVPVALKDNIMTRKLRTTCGSRMLDNFVPPYDAAVVEKLRAAGATVHAKTNMDEFAMGATGESSFFGATRNPWNPALVPGGSSSGSAAIVAYGGALAAVGSDTGGSIRQPAAFCGVVGLKPTYGRVSRHGIGALVSSLDQAGPIARNVRDAALLMDILTGHDGRDSTSDRRAAAAAPCLPTVEDGIRGVKIGVDRSLVEREGVSPETAAAFAKGIALAKEAGAEIVDAPLPMLEYLVATYYILNVCEASTNMTRFDGVRYGERVGDGDLWDVYAETRGACLGDEVKRRIMMGSYALSKGYYDAYYLKASRVRRLFCNEMEKLFGGVDAVLMPVSPAPPRRIGTKATVLENYLGDIFTIPASLAGTGAVAYPVGMSGALPAGVQAVGPAFSEPLLCRIARAAEKAAALTDAPWTKAAPEEAK